MPIRSLFSNNVFGTCFYKVKFQILTVTMKITAFWDTAHGSLTQVN
jgi:hypothetical protein